ncbi:histidine kinase [Pedobacter sp. ISL-68]|uniref:sensor histidine kinase n=1 Tax=unclassified Pedobacter TaxID=2628915 RepID=UPI001BE7754E|nr:MULTISPECIES: sensor histidine kinase [unclassified Pedobacter]MBT2563749.1 histidine kinase [Pedobacter sp. ISL-64]MBT2589641.1 histidine kinase [Pedobacter sp. ISL-68]
MHKFIYERQKFFSKAVWIHLLCWSIFIFSEVVVTGLLRDRFSSFSFYFFFYSLNISFFYFHAYALTAFSKRVGVKRFFWITITVVAELTLYVVLTISLSIFLKEVLKSEPEGGLKLNRVYYISTVWRCIYFLLYSTGYFFLKSYLSRQKRDMEKTLEISRLQNLVLTVEKDFLRSQITPHLFFNTLNFIKFSAVKNPAVAEDAVDTLSDIMDFALASNKREYVPLSSELEQIGNMIALNQMRYQGKLFFDFKEDIKDPEIQIIPLVLLTLTENLFKHGNLSAPDHPAWIEITTDHNTIVFRSSNLPAKSSLGKGHGTGLKNIMSRLENAYSGRYSFDYGMNGTNFDVELKIPHLI